MTITFIALTVVFSLVVRRLQLIWLAIAIACGVGVYEQVLAPMAVLLLAIYGIISYCYFHKEQLAVDLPILANRLVQGVLLLLVLIMTGAFALHWVPFIHNQLVFDRIYVSAQSVPFSMYFNFDKVMAALILYGTSFLPWLERRITWRSLGLTLGLLTLCVGALAVVSVQSRYVNFDPKLPAEIMPKWVLNNLLLVCFAEEVIFRGVLLNILKQALLAWPRLRYLPLVLTSLLFGVAHHGGGISYIILAGLCGLFYGYTYERTSSIACAMLVHFGLNLAHLLLFSYPMAQVLLPVR